MDELQSLICLDCMEIILDENYVDIGFGYVYHTQCKQHVFSTYENSPKIEGIKAKKDDSE